MTLSTTQKKSLGAIWPRALSFLMSARQLGKIQIEDAEIQGIPERAHNLEHSVSFYLLLGFATELLLKVAYILSGGSKPIAMYGHDLCKVLEEAKCLGWEPFPSQLEWLVASQQTAHIKFYHRYDTAPTQQEVPDMKEAVQILWDLAKYLESQNPDIWDY